MTMLSINHDAKGIVMWDYPTEPDINNITSSLSRVISSATVASFLLGSFVQMKLPVSGLSRVDVAAWTVESQMLISVVSMGYVGTAGNVSIVLPVGASAVNTTLWGSTWVVNGTTMIKSGISALEVDLLILDI